MVPLAAAAGLLTCCVVVPAAWAEDVNLVPNPRFAGNGGSLQGPVTGTAPDYWRAFGVGGGAGELAIVPLAADELYPGSPPTNAVRWQVNVFGADQGFDHYAHHLPLLTGREYHFEVYIRSANTDGTPQRCDISMPLFGPSGYLGREPGSLRNVVATASAWTKVVGPAFSDAVAISAHLAFRARNDGGQNAILIAMPEVFGPPDRFVTPSPAEIAQRTSWSSTDKLIGTSYFYWYRWPDMHFFDNAERTDDALTDHFVDPERVDMYSKDWHKGELADVMEAGIDMVWPVYWAAPGNFDNPSYALYHEALIPLQQAREELIAEGHNPPKIGMFYDTTSLLNGVRGLPGPGGADLTTPEGKDIFYRTIRSFFCTVHPKHWACIDGRPVVVLYSASFAANYNQSTFEYVYDRFAADFDGVTPWIIRERSWQVQVDSDYRWGAALFGPFIDGTAAVGPGYNDTAVPGRSTPIRMREGGNFYRYNWLGVLRSPTNVVHVETWNELHEGTGICETVEHGRDYITLTAHYAAHFKAGTIPDETIVLEYPDPLPRGPDYDDGPEYANVREVSIRAEAGGIVMAGLDPREGGDGQLEHVAYNGDYYLRTEPGFVHRYGYFNVKDPFYFGQRRRAQLTVTYLDVGNGPVQLQYDSWNPQATLDGAYTNTPSFQLANTGQHRTRTYTLEDARFANRQNGSSDFRFYVGNGAVLYIKEIRVRVLDLPEPVLKVAAVDPAPNAVIYDLPQRIAVTFTTAVDPNTVNAATFRLTRSGGDDVFGNSNDVAVEAAAITAAGNQAVFDLSGVAVPPDTYRVLLAGTVLGPLWINDPVMDLTGRPLDGKFDGTLPSGDGTGGWHFIATFKVNRVRGDFEGDGDVDVSDFAYLQRCLTGSLQVVTDAACAAADLNGDRYIDGHDLNLFVECLGGPGVEPAAHCME
ncbi:MAG TPA: DUF5010 domain-containing protein [Phycisphaerae bacterium]|nr:DUF5010 domain-containing protein [Phycisphaerae bacterium]HQE30051.1 DUF5010 domain-containing protein [Phycisphaerae bacterium]